MLWPLQDRPDGIDRLLAQRGLLGEVALALASDIGPDGQFGEQWLVVTPKRTLVLATEDGDVRVLRDLPTPELKDVKVEPEVGGAVLQVRRDGVILPLIQFSNRLSHDFARAANGIERLAADGELGEAPVDDHAVRTCPTCGRRLSPYSSVCPKCLKRHKVLARLLGLALPHWRQLLPLFVLMIFGSFAHLVPGRMVRYLLDNVLKPEAATVHLPLVGAVSPIAALGLVVSTLALIVLVTAAVQVITRRLAGWLGNRITFELRSMVYNALQRLSLSFYDRRQVGHVMASVTHDTEHLQHLLVDALPMFFVNVLMTLAIGSYAFVINWRLALWILVPVPAIVAITKWVWPWLHRMLRRLWERRARLSGHLADTLTGIRVVRAFGQEDREIDRFGQRNVEFFNAGVRVEYSFAWLFPSIGALMGLGMVIIWYVGGRHVIGQRYGMSTGKLMQLVMYLGMFYQAVQMMTRIISWLTRSLTATERVFEIVDTEPEIQDAPDAIPMPDLKGCVRFENVTFGYSKLKPVLEHIDLEVNPGELLGLVGHSGAGKTTITNLLARFYDVDEGHVTIDGVDIRKIPKDDLHRQMGIVLQETILFNGTIAENIAYARPDATALEVMRAAKAANAHDFIVNLPDGYDFQVGERGQRLSAGEGQRVAIARAILGNPRILILDEATASVDTETESQIQEALSRLVSGRTTFAIAHRLSTLRNADRLLVIEHGHEAEIGTHDELMAKRGVYYRLVKMQRQVSRVRAVAG